MAANSSAADRFSQLAIVIIAGLLAVRIVLALFSPLELYADEAQYWRCGESLDWV